VDYPRGSEVPLNPTLSLLVLLPTVAWAAPLEIAHQGRLLDASGAPVSGSESVGVALYSVVTGGSPLWDQAYTVDVQDGYYSVVLSTDASGDPLDAAWFASSVWVEVRRNGTPIGARTPLASVPSAFTALRVAGSTAHIVNTAGVRKWSDGTMATTCEAYRNGTGTKTYAGDIGSGLYASSWGVNMWCDMDTDGGGWMLMLNYNHTGGTNPALSATGLPSSLSDNKHSYLSGLFPAGYFDEVRFYCTTSAHTRVIHFKTGHWRVATDAQYAQSVATAGTYAEYWQPLDGHTANLPQAGNAEVGTAGIAFTDFPFYLGNAYHWGISGHGLRWECDDWASPPGGGSGFQNTTVHRIWVR
jgi:hypothetical protein